MQVIYRAENIIDANLLKDVLEEHEIPAFVNGEFLQGGIGEVPAIGLVTVSVADSNSEVARCLVEQFETQLQGSDEASLSGSVGDGLLEH